MSDGGRGAHPPPPHRHEDVPLGTVPAGPRLFHWAGEFQQDNAVLRGAKVRSIGTYVFAAGAL